MELEAQIEQLDAALLTQVQASFPSKLSDTDRVLVNSYLVLGHATLEEYLELSFERHFRRMCGWLIADFVPLECVRFSYAIADLLAEEKTAYTRRHTAQLIRNRGLAAFQSKLRQNHGLKSHNVQSLAQTVGLHWPDFEQHLNVQLSDLDTLGAKRGSAGHLSPFTENVTEITASDGPDDVRNWVEGGCTAVKSIDSYLRDIVDRGSPQTLIGDWDGN